LRCHNQTDPLPRIIVATAIGAKAWAGATTDDQFAFYPTMDRARVEIVVLNSDGCDPQRFDFLIRAKQTRKAVANADDVFEIITRDSYEREWR
jgi:hypothetical protein